MFHVLTLVVVGDVKILRDLTIRSNAFENLINLREIAIERTKIEKLEKDSFNIKSKSRDHFLIFF